MDPARKYRRSYLRQGDHQQVVNLLKRACNSSHMNYPMPEQTDTLNYKAEFTTEDFRKILYGFVPEDMDDQWFMYMEKKTLYIHKSWTGTCVFTVDFVEESGKFKVSRAVVNKNPDQYRADGLIYDEKLLDYLIRNCLLKEQVSFPDECQKLDTLEASGGQLPLHDGNQQLRSLESSDDQHNTHSK